MLTGEHRALIEQWQHIAVKWSANAFPREWAVLGDDVAYDVVTDAVIKASQQFVRDGLTDFRSCSQKWIRLDLRQAARRLRRLPTCAISEEDTPGRPENDPESPGVDDILAPLGPREAYVVRRVAVDGVSYQVVAGEVGFSKAGVHATYQRALAKLREVVPCP